MAYGRINVGGGKDLTAELNQQAQIIEELETKLDAIGAVDITSEVNENTDLIAQVMAELQGKAFAPAVTEGDYVWKKCELTDGKSYTVTNPKCTIAGNSSTTDKNFAITSDSFDVYAIDANFLSGFVFTYGLVDSAINDKYTLTLTSSTAYTLACPSVNTITGTYTYNAEAGVIVLSNVDGIKFNGSGANNGSYTGTKTYVDVRDRAGEIINYVTSDDDTKYPVAGEMDGCWYVKYDASTSVPENIKKDVNIWGVLGTMSEGVSGIDFGIVTPSSQTTTLTVNHKLGVVPSKAYIVIASDNASYSTTTVLSLGTNYYKLSNGSYTYGSAVSYTSFSGQYSNKPALSASSITFNASSASFPAGVSYMWFAIA